MNATTLEQAEAALRIAESRWLDTSLALKRATVEASNAKEQLNHALERWYDFVKEAK